MATGMFFHLKITAVVLLISTSIFVTTVTSDSNFVFTDPPLLCNEEFKPSYCGFPNVSLDNMLNLDDYDNCGPGKLPLNVRNYFLGASGKAITYRQNIRAFDNIKILPRILRDVSNVDISTTVLGQKVPFPVGLAPAAGQKLGHFEGEVATARGMARTGAIMVLSSISTSSIEDVYNAALSSTPNGATPLLWMQVYMLKNRNEVLRYVKRAENAGFKALMMTVDTPSFASRKCQSTGVWQSGRYPNLDNETYSRDKLDSSVTYNDLKWLVSNTKLPVVAKGVLTGTEAINVVDAGATAIVVSNHGGRHVDGDPATIDVLPEVIRTLRKKHPEVEVYLDGGIRSGHSVFKALSRGADYVFVGRPQLWGLAIAGDKGVEKALTILRTEFKEVMELAGYHNIKELNDCSSS